MKFKSLRRSGSRQQNVLASILVGVSLAAIPLAGHAVENKVIMVPVQRHAIYNDYNGDGASDLAVMTPSVSWYVRALDVGVISPRIISWNGPLLGPSPVGVGGVPAAQSVGFIPVTGDYNGDGRCDLASYSPVTKNWAIYSTNALLSNASGLWGWPGEIPVPGDYNGDGWWDLAMYWPAAGKWYIQGVTSTGRITIAYGTSWGASTMIPVPGDYDGDRRSDLALWDFSTGRWYIRSVAGSVIVWGVQWGSSGMIPVPGDYNGDGRADLALYQESSGRWYILPVNANGTTGVPLAFGLAWGYSGAAAVSGDFDGDGCSDLSVYDRLSGAWYILKIKPAPQVLSNVGDVVWGGQGMIPAGVCGLVVANPLSSQFQWHRAGITWQLIGEGGRAPYSFVANATMPAGLSLSRSGLISGTPQTSGSFNINITMNDSNGCSCRSRLTLTIFSR